MTDEPTGHPDVPIPPIPTPTEQQAGVQPAAPPSAAPSASTLPPPAAPSLGSEPPQGPPAVVPAAKTGMPGWVWLIIGGGALLIVVFIVIAVLVFGAISSAMDSQTPAPVGSAEPTPEPEGDGVVTDLPEQITFAAGAELPSDQLPGFSTTLIGDPAWEADPADVDPFDGSSTYTHLASGCELFTFQTYATDLVFDPADDYYNSELVLKSFFETDDIGQPGSYFFDANLGTSGVEVAAIIVGRESGAAQLTTARGFGASNIALLTSLSCSDQATAIDIFENVAIQTIGVEFLPE